ncbi:MAG TPA: thiamine pyrophosphate-binding protein [Paucimonas sp.]|nr:thiamine pyrophosphate-binding protein [Paucimonas sp.]
MPLQPVSRPAARLDAADLLLAYLDQIGVDAIFGVIGGAIEPLYAALARHARAGGRIRHISARHETGAALMAEGYARETGKLGVCCATSGPGATNLITGVADAYCNEVPLLVLTGQPAMPLFGRDAFQESSCTGVDIPAMFGHITRYNTLVSHAAQFEAKLVRAIHRAHQKPHGPAHLSLPADVLSAPLDAAGPGVDLPALLKARAPLDESEIAALDGELRRAGAVVLVLGEDAAPAALDAVALAERLDARILVTPDAKGLINTRHPLYGGAIGFGGHPEAMQILNGEPDLILSIGARYGEWNSAKWHPQLMNGRMIHIDDCATHFERVPQARLHVGGDIGAVLRRLLQAQDERRMRHTRRPAPRADQPPQAEAVQAAPAPSAKVHPERLMKTLSRVCPAATRVVADTGNSAAWAVRALETFDAAGARQAFERPWLQVAMEFATMGWAIGVAVGIAYGNRKAPVVCITDDGSCLMSGQEITVAQEMGLGVVFAVLNDGAFGMVKHSQILHGGERIGAELPAVNFKAMAASMGIPGHEVRNQADLESLPFDEIFARKGPTLLDIRIDPHVPPPFHKRPPR